MTALYHKFSSCKSEKPHSSKSMDIISKLLRHYDRIEGIIDGKFLPPVMADIDPVNGFCNLACSWCSQAASRASRPTTFMEPDVLKRLPEFAAAWGIKAFRIAGDSEPTLNKHLSILIDSCHANGVDAGLITNGTYIERINNLAKLTFLGISLDASTRETWSSIKKSAPELFDKIIDNIKKVRQECPDLDMTIKFLRWDKKKSLSQSEFSKELAQVDDFECQPDNAADAELLPELAKRLDCNFMIKPCYPKDFPKQYQFEVCRATPLGCVFTAQKTVEACCDQRGFFVLVKDFTADDWQALPKFWGSEEHKKVIASINPQKCLGCAKHNMNAVLENIVLEGKWSKSMQVNFI